MGTVREGKERQYLGNLFIIKNITFWPLYARANLWAAWVYVLELKRTTDQVIEVDQGDAQY